LEVYGLKFMEVPAWEVKEKCWLDTQSELHGRPTETMTGTKQETQDKTENYQCNTGVQPMGG